MTKKEAKKSAPTFDALKGEYALLWRDMEVRDSKRRTLEATARRIIGQRPRYEPVSKATGVPWFVIGIIHQMECNLSFAKHLHNGDPLSSKTRLVPRGRPAGVWPPVGQEPWVASAIDALTMPGKNFDQITDWSIERIAYVFELYNGFGYRLYRHIHSPYLWSFTTHYSRGKYVADGKWSATAVSAQSGAMALLKVMMEIDPLQVDLPAPVEVPLWPKPEDAGDKPTVGPVKEAAESRSVLALIVGFFTLVVQTFTDWIGAVADGIAGVFAAVPAINTEVSGVMTPLESLGATMKINMAGIATTVGGLCILIAIVRHVRDKMELRARREQQGE